MAHPLPGLFNPLPSSASLAGSVPLCCPSASSLQLLVLWWLHVKFLHLMWSLLSVIDLRCLLPLSLALSILPILLQFDLGEAAVISLLTFSLG